MTLTIQIAIASLLHRTPFRPGILLSTEGSPVIMRISRPSNFNLDFFYNTPNSINDWIKPETSIEECLHRIEVAKFRSGYHLELVRDDELGQAVAFRAQDRN